MSVKPWYIKFEYEVNDKALPRHVSRNYSKDSTTIKVLKLFEANDILPLIDSMIKFMNEESSHNREIVKSRLSYWHEARLALNERGI